MNPELVSIICPCYNEQSHIAACIDSILKQDYNLNYVEIIIVDGISNDGTRKIIEDYQRQYPFILLLDNPKRIAPVAMNIGIQAANGKYIVRIDAHSIYPTTYISILLHYLQMLPNAENVGPICNTIPANNSTIARAIAIASSHKFGVGNSMFRIGTNEVKKVDTVPFGCWRKQWLIDIGCFDEDLVRNQDDELNARIIEHGGSIYLIPELVVDYYARPTLAKTWKMFYQYGLYKPLVNKKLKRPASIRQFAPPLLVLFFIPALPVYLLFIIVISIINRNIALVLTFPTIHLSYGIGYWLGLYKILTHSSIDIKCNH